MLSFPHVDPYHGTLWTSRPIGFLHPQINNNNNNNNNNNKNHNNNNSVEYPITLSDFGGGGALEVSLHVQSRLAGRSPVVKLIHVLLTGESGEGPATGTSSMFIASWFQRHAGLLIVCAVGILIIVLIVILCILIFKKGILR